MSPIVRAYSAVLSHKKSPERLWVSGRTIHEKSKHIGVVKIPRCETKTLRYVNRAAFDKRDIRGLRQFCRSTRTCNHGDECRLQSCKKALFDPDDTFKIVETKEIHEDPDEESCKTRASTCGVFDTPELMAASNLLRWSSPSSEFTYPWVDATDKDNQLVSYYDDWVVPGKKEASRHGVKFTSASSFNPERTQSLGQPSRPKPPQSSIVIDADADAHVEEDLTQIDRDMEAAAEMEEDHHEIENIDPIAPVAVVATNSSISDKLASLPIAMRIHAPQQAGGSYKTPRMQSVE